MADIMTGIVERVPPEEREVVAGEMKPHR